MFNFIVQGIGICGTATNVISYQFKKKFVLFFLQLIGTICFVVHYALLGSWAGCIVNFVGVLRSIYLLINKEKKSLIIEYSFATLFLIAAFLSIILKLDNWLAILPGIGSFIQTIGLWQKSPKKTRWFQILGASPEWMTYNIINGSIGGVICEAFTIISSIIYLVRHRKDNESDIK